jgi:alkylation response protein AidB-like acyl-CoA dehydrogenase
MNKGLDKETLDLTLESLKDFTASHLPEKKILELDAQEEFPVEIVREMCGSGLGIQLLFIPEEFEGMGGGAFDIYRAWQPVCWPLSSEAILSSSVVHTTKRNCG